jgi:hypothetical protein
VPARVTGASAYDLYARHEPAGSGELLQILPGGRA